MDHIAAELGIDRRELRLRNCYRDGDHGPTGQELPDVAFQECFDRLEQVAPWADVSRRRPNRGVGIAPVMWLTNPMPGGLTLKLNEDGTVTIVTAATEIGTGAMTQGVTQIVAEELGVRPEDVILVEPDTDVAPYDAGAQGGRTTHALGTAAVRAAAEVREQVFETAAAMLEADAGDLELVDGEVRVRGAVERAVPLAAVATTALWTGGPIQGKGKHVAPPIPFDTGCVVGSYFTTLHAPTFSVHLAEVEVDPDTGKVDVLRYVVVQDVGRAVNPAAIAGQVDGGVAQGIGYALFEELRLEDGVCVDTGFGSYRLPTALDVPPIETILLERPAAYGAYGVKSAAEVPVVPVAAVIANAVSDAIGKPLDRLPLTPFRVLEAIRSG
jgi:CO/xanthine dehydrogenase Mo-binding subunit